jgi:hypothetical protein
MRGKGRPTISFGPGGNPSASFWRIRPQRPIFVAFELFRGQSILSAPLKGIPSSYDRGHSGSFKPNQGIFLEPCQQTKLPQSIKIVFASRSFPIHYSLFTIPYSL